MRSPRSAMCAAVVGDRGSARATESRSVVSFTCMLLVAALAAAERDVSKYLCVLWRELLCMLLLSFGELPCCDAGNGSGSSAMSAMPGSTSARPLADP